MPFQLGSAFGKIVIDTSEMRKNLNSAREQLRGIGGLMSGAVGGAVAGLTVAFVNLGKQAAQALLQVAERGVELQATLETAGVAFSEMFGDPKMGAATLAFLDDAAKKLRIGKGVANK
jgi:hypothetical protein